MIISFVVISILLFLLWWWFLENIYKDYGVTMIIVFIFVIPLFSHILFEEWITKYEYDFALYCWIILLIANEIVKKKIYDKLIIKITIIFMWLITFAFCFPLITNISLFDFIKNDCNIKWNISYDSKTKVYYLPECWKYSEVEINPKYWEKWFCSEQEAINYWFEKSYTCP